MPIQSPPKGERINNTPLKGTEEATKNSLAKKREHPSNRKKMNEELSILDLLLMAWKWLCRQMKKLGRVAISAIRLTYRRWWVIALVMLPVIAVTLWYCRTDNRKYDVEARAIIYGSSYDVAAETYSAIGNAFHGNEGSEEQTIQAVLGITKEEAKGLKRFTTMPVLRNRAGYVYEDKTARLEHYSDKDSIIYMASEQIMLHFQMKHPANVGKIEEGILRYMNQNEIMRRSYETLYANLQDQLAFVNRQIELMDTISRNYYTNAANSSKTQLAKGDASIIVGKHEIQFLTNDITELYKQKRALETDLAVCTAPVVLKNHFVVKASAINNPIKYGVIAIVIGYLLGLLLAAWIDNRKQINNWLNEKN